MPKNTVESLMADVPEMTMKDIVAAHHRRTYAGTQATNNLMASIRGDMAGSPANAMLHPRTWQQRCLRIWEGYNTDPFFLRMVNRAVEFSANGSMFEITGDIDTNESWTDRVENKRKTEKAEREESFWNAWAEQINENVNGIVPGLDEVNSWIVKHLLLSAMWVGAWELGEMKHGKQTFIVPTKMTCYPAPAISIRRERDVFGSERFFYRLPPGSKSIPIREGERVDTIDSIWAKGPLDQELPLMNRQNGLGQTESFVLRYNWSPADLVTQRNGNIVNTGAGLYPILPFLGLLPALVTRQKLFAADLSILDGIINFIMQWKIGDKDHPPEAPKYVNGKLVKTGTIAEVQRLIQQGRFGPAMELFLPYYVELKLLTPDTSTLVNEVKYIQSTIEIFQAFGIFFSRSASGSRERMERINITNFEEFLAALRRHCAAFWKMMATHIVKLNPGKLTHVPRWVLNPLNTKNDAFVNQLHALAKIGRLSARTLLKHHGLDESTEALRMAHEQATDMDDLFDANVPTSFVQSVQPDWGGKGKTQPAGGPPDGKGRTQTRISPTRQQGRPSKNVNRTPGKELPQVEKSATRRGRKSKE